DHENLQHRVVATDAAARTAPEREIGEGLAELVVWFEETIWIEVFRAVPVAWRVVRSIDMRDDRRTGGDSDVAYSVVSDCHAVDHPERRIEAQTFLYDLSCEFELRNVGVSQR